MVYVVVAYGRFITDELLAAPRLGVVNIHPSLLPRHRGPSPVSTAILNNDESTSVSIMLLDEGMDTGPILAQSQPVEISSDLRCDALTERLFEMGASMLPDVLRDYGAGKLTPRPQNDGRRNGHESDQKRRWEHRLERVSGPYRPDEPGLSPLARHQHVPAPRDTQGDRRRNLRRYDYSAATRSGHCV